MQQKIKSSFFFFCCFLLFFSCEKKQEKKQEAVQVSGYHVIPKTIPADFSFIGVAKSSHIVQIRARVEGYLEKILYDEGGLVQAGSKMFVLDRRPFIAKVQHAKAELSRQEALLWDAIQVKNRMIPLYKQHAVSQRDMDNAIADELSAKANVEAAEADLASAELNLSFATLKAPVTGMAGQAIYREGALISPGPHNLLTDIYVIDPIWVDFSVSEGDILQARKEHQKKLLQYPPNMDFTIEVIMADGTVMPAQGKVDFTDPALQQSTGTMLVRSVLSNPQGYLRPGQFVRVVVKGATRPEAIIVPQSAVQEGQNGSFVYVVNHEGRAVRRAVTLGEWYQNFWIIRSGLQHDDIVIAEGVNKVINQTPVQIKKWISAPHKEEQSPPIEW